MELSGTTDMSIIIQIKHANEQSKILQSLKKRSFGSVGMANLRFFFANFLKNIFPLDIEPMEYFFSLNTFQKGKCYQSLTLFVKYPPEISLHDFFIL